MSMFIKKNNLVSDQRGMAAILVTVILMIVISLIVLGFAQTIRREQRNTLDNQLATQAFYAAESGINLAEEKLKIHGSTTKNDCPAVAPHFTPADYNIGENEEITCLLIKNELESLEYQNAGLDSIPLLLRAKTGNIQNLYISWQSSSTNSLSSCSGSPSGNNFGPNNVSSGCKQPVIRVDFVPVGNGVGLNSATLAAQQFTTFLYPTNSMNPVNYSAGGMGTIASARCATATSTLSPRLCTANIKNLSNTSYGVRIMSIYGESDITIIATGAGATPITLVDGQIQIDSTAKASDVLRRVQARMTLSSGDIPDFGITSAAGLCKRYVISGGTVEDPGIAACDIP